MNIKNISGVRLCVTCKVSKPATTEYFYSDKNRSLGLMYRCKSCDKKRVDGRNPKVRYAQFTLEQKQKKFAIGKIYRRTLKGRSISLQKAYENADKAKGFYCTITQYDIAKILNSPCTYCGYPATGFDRIDNLNGHHLNNCVPACKECNVARMDNFTHAEMFIIGQSIKSVKDQRNTLSNILNKAG